MEAVLGDSKKMALLRAIMQVQFELVELNLFLDTHPTDFAALSAYRMYSDQLARLRTEYESVFGPLLNFGWGAANATWQWNDEPWPWEINWKRGA